MSQSARRHSSAWVYRGVVVLLADRSSFSSYVRDSSDARVVRESLIAFYSKSRYQIICSRGMLYQFVGDEVIGLFGIPDREEEDTVQAALDSAKSLMSIGDSVSQHWQRQIDRVQTAGGVHIGLAIGDIQIVLLSSFGRTHIGVNAITFTRPERTCRLTPWRNVHP